MAVKTIFTISPNTINNNNFANIKHEMYSLLIKKSKKKLIKFKKIKNKI